MNTKKYSVLLVGIFAARVIMAVTVLTPPLSDVLENSSVTFECRWNGTEEIKVSYWTVRDTGTSFIGHVLFDKNDTCSATGTINSSDSFAWRCAKPSSFSLILKSVKREDHMEEWYCFMRFMQSNPSRILVQVPVESVEMVSHPGERTEIKENKSESFKCKTSSCRPIPSISWFLISPDQRRKLNITEKAKQTPTAESSANFTEVTSVINYTFNRTLNNWFIYCQAANIPRKNVTSSIKKLDILYPPDDEPKVTDLQDGGVYRVVKNQLGQLSCVATGGNPLALLTWFCFRGNSVSNDTGNETVTSTVTWTALRSQDDKPCTCVAEHPFGTSNVSVNVKVLYPPDTPLFKIEDEYVIDFIEIIQNNSKTVMCTSESNPTSDYKWTRPSTSKESAQELNISSAQAKDEGEYKCSVNNTMIATDGSLLKGRNSSVITVNILYPPKSPRLIYIDNTTISPITGKSMDVVHGDQFELLCETVGHPVPTYRWENTDVGNVSTVIAGQSVNKTCTATNNMTETVGEIRIGSVSATVFVKVLYPPVISNINVYNSSGNTLNVTNELKVIERESFNLTCESDGRPSPKYKWNINDNVTIRHQIIEKRNISRTEGGNYTCNAFNTMNRTFGNSTVESSQRSILVYVFYPAEVGKLANITVLEGSYINISCPVIPGNVPETTVQWIPGDASKGSYLYISNVSRNDEKIYTCYVNTTMSPTFGTPKMKINNGMFHLIVDYKAVVKKFYIGEETNNNTFLVNESEDVTFRCFVDSKPSTGARVLKNGRAFHVSDNNTVEYTLKNIQCTDFGLYLCTGKNDYNNGTMSTKNLTLYIKCSPRPSPFVDLIKNVLSARGVSATMRFTALAYPEPDHQSGFIWSYMNGSDTIPLRNGSNVVIWSSQLHSYLTIKNVTQADYGHYLLMIENPIDIYEQHFYLKPYDVPMPPLVYTWIEYETSITITIKAGFDGGLSQRLNLRYRKENEKKWVQKSMTGIISDVFNYTISRLSSGTSYKIIIFATNMLGNSTEVILFTETKDQSPEDIKPSSKTGLIAGTTFGVILFITLMICIGIFIYRKRGSKDVEQLLYQNISFRAHQRKYNKERENVEIKETRFEDHQEIDCAQSEFHEPTEYINSPEALQMIKRIRVSELYTYLLENDEDSFGVDFKKLPTGLEKPYTFAIKPENIAMNRYNGIYPYDHSRVTLHGHPDFFINACYIDGYKRPKAYIASLGPTEITTSGFKTFWQMVWHENSDIVVMLTNLREPSGMKCERYWPKTAGASEHYGDVCVSSQKFEVFAEYTVRTVTILKDKERRTVTHLHYTAWPDKKVPEDVTSLLEFRQRIKITPTNSLGPIIVHCSAGIGRTGTLIALDRLIEEGKCEGSVNAYDCVFSMREQRVRMVQTLEQYIYIYKALVNALAFESEVIPIASFQEYAVATNDIVYSRQFQQLRQSVEADSKDDIATRTANERLTQKNRTNADVPAGRFRILLYMNRENDDSDYINAVYMNSFKKNEYFIVAQSPLPNTVNDFICMMYQENCTCIVTMEDLKEPGMVVGVYLPEDRSKLTVGNFTVSSTRLDTKHHCIIRKVGIKFTGKYDRGEKTLYHLQFTKWMTGQDTPVNVTEFVQFVNEVEEYASQFCEEKSHVLVHCLKANERSGLFCAVTTLVEKLKFERQVNVLNTLRHLRTRRRTAITSKDQLKFCYEAASTYIEMMRP